ncbi:MAG TPA: PAN domain-containing protein [Candidatus Binatia bacterium]|nr:PAN domain-containing protein [Candidatus Binatia bacterium]
MLLRSAFIGAVSLAAIVSAASAGETARLPGAYTSLTTTNAAACARACAEDGICMAWSFHAGDQCQLSAVVSVQPIQALASGFSSRAPAALRPSTPIVYAEVAPQLAAQTPIVETPASIEAENDDLVLLGGPGEGDLRLGLR